MRLLFFTAILATLVWIGFMVAYAVFIPDVKIDVYQGECATHYRHWPIGGDDQWSTGCE